MLGSLGSCVLSSVSGWLSFKRVKPKNNKRSGLALTILAGGVILAIFGLLAIYDASVVEGYKDFSDKFHFVKQQAVWLVIGIVVSLFAAGFPLATLKKYSHVFLLGCLFLMVLVLIPGIGSKFLGARRWIIFGPIVIQPSELIKIALILYLARWLLGLVMLQPDLGTGVVIVGTCFILYYLSGANLKDISIFMGLLVITMSVLVFASPYRMNRLKTFMDPTSDPLGASYHINQVLYGLGSGGLTGVGVGQSRQKFAYLPEATTDSIFVIIAEEFGFIGGAAVILGLVGLCLASLNI
ncbi:MAG: Stage V sporulation protein E, partial [Candidatus Nomurabacteria bacterium GW2011_GWF1_31_48]